MIQMQTLEKRNQVMMMKKVMKTKKKVTTMKVNPHYQGHGWVLGLVSSIHELNRCVLFLKHRYALTRHRDWSLL
jgi:hypothetical protein